MHYTKQITVEHENELLRARVACLEEENAKLKSQIESGKLINRAKAVLMKKYRLQEPQAHRHLQKAAMDLRVPLSALAKRVLEGLELAPPQP